MAPVTRNRHGGKASAAASASTTGAAAAAADGGGGDASPAPSGRSTPGRAWPSGNSAHTHGAGGSLDDLNRLQYDAEGPLAAAALDRAHVTPRRRRAAEPTLRDEAGSLALLVLLYMVQGVPLGLTTGALPFMLSSKLSLTQMGIFALAAYPYSLKLLWSPVVDSLYFRRVGRRKSWIVPIQLATAGLLLGAASWIQTLYEAADVWALTSIFVVFVFLMATQDIAVDGWALTLLSPAHVPYASTCQTVGTTTGIFTSFTVFLALQDAAFCNRYIRANPYLGGLFGSTPVDAGLVSLSGYMRFWGWAFAAVTAFIAACVRESAEEEARAEAAALAPLTGEERALLAGDGGADPSGAASGRTTPTAPSASGARGGGGGGASPSPSASLAGLGAAAEASGGGGKAGGKSPPPPARSTAAELGAAYLELWRLLRLPAVWKLSALLLSYRLGVLAAEGAASMKLIEKGVAKEALAFLVLFQFPVELFSAVVAGRWAANHSPYAPFMTGYGLRLLTAAATVAVTAAFPPGASSLTEHRAEFGVLAAVSLATSFVSYLSFTALGSFYNTISDPEMGGTYLTLLNTIANMGFLLPRTPLFWLMDVLTVPRCTDAATGAALAAACSKKAIDWGRDGGGACAAAGGTCGLASDGYYIVSAASLVVGALLGVVYIGFVRGIMREPLASWRAGGGAGAGATGGSGGSAVGDAPAGAVAKRLL